MKWFLLIQPKMKAASLLFSIMLVTIFTSFNLKHSLREMNQTLTTVYEDRLQPAVGLVYLSEYLHGKRLLLETFLATQQATPSSELMAQLHQYDTESRLQLDEFEKTKLSQGEEHRLKVFKREINQYARLEKSVMQLSATGQPQAAIQLFHQQGGALFQQAILSLHELARIQAQTGGEALLHGHQEAAGGSINTTLLIAIAVIMGLLIQGLIFKPKRIDGSSPYFHLN